MSVQKQIESILNPRSVAVIGASNDPSKWGGSVLALLRKFGFRGNIFPINPRADTVQGLAAFQSVSAVQQPVDVAVLAVPSDKAPAALKDCAQAGVGAVLIMTAQFAESGPEGVALQQEVEAIVSDAGMRMIGPNCMGYFSSASDLCLLNAQAFIRNDTMHKGHIALISQSGALAGAILARSYDIGAAFSFCVSLGNQADLEVCDFLEYAIADANTHIIALYVEGLKNPGRFRSLLEAARKAGKPVLVTKAGRTSSGTKAVQSHTASMAGAYQTFRATVEAQAGIILEDPLDMVAEAANWDVDRPLRGSRVAVLSGSGGGGALAVDALEGLALHAANLSDQGRAALSRLAPGSAARLPFDIGAVPTPAQQPVSSDSWFQDVLTTALDDADVDAGLFLMTTQPDMTGAAEAFIAAHRSSDKPSVFINAASSCGAEPVARLKAAGLAHFTGLQPATLHFKHRHDYARQCALLALPDQRPGIDTQALERIASTLPAGTVSEAQTKALLNAAGLPTASGRVAVSAEEAVAIANELGYPVVMKIVSEQITHKSDVGGVLLGVQDASAVQRAFEQLKQAAARVSGATFEGSLVQQMAKADAELLVGTHWDEQLGAFLTFGFGGTLVELQRDTCLLPADSSAAVIKDALTMLRQFPVLTGYRGKPLADLDRLVDIIQRMGCLAGYFGAKLLECEANPLMIRGEHIVVADARAVWNPAL